MFVLPDACIATSAEESDWDGGGGERGLGKWKSIWRRRRIGFENQRRESSEGGGVVANGGLTEVSKGKRSQWIGFPHIHFQRFWVSGFLWKCKALVKPFHFGLCLWSRLIYFVLTLKKVIYGDMEGGLQETHLWGYGGWAAFCIRPKFSSFFIHPHFYLGNQIYILVKLKYSSLS